MASEDLLKKAVAAFNALSPEQQAEMLEEQRQSWVRGNVGLSRDERGMNSPVMPRPTTVMASEYCKFPHCECSMGAAERCKRIRTRPAPADLKAGDRKHYKLIRKSLQNKGLLPADTDTGLETIGYGSPGSLQMVMDGQMDHASVTSTSGGVFTEPVCFRSQAEELLAAERAKKEELDAECRVLAKRCIEKDARIKELEADVKREAQSSTHNAQDCLDEQLRAEALEAKLAVAEKALEPFADHANDRAVDDTGWRDKETVKIVVSIGDLRKARAVLGGKPSC